MLVAIIVACEILFWVFVVMGLATRYILRRKRASIAVLAMSPLVDIVLLIASAVSIRSGDVPSVEHSLAAFYLGFSIAYGHRIIAWMDARFAHRFNNRPLPPRRTGKAYTIACWKDVVATGLATAITCAVLYGMEVLTPAGTSTSALDSSYGLAGLIFVIELLWAISYTIWPRQ